MAGFSKPFTDFSLGEISPKHLSMVISDETNKGVSFLQNAFTNKTRGLERRTGTIKVAKTRFPVASDYEEVRCVDFFIGLGHSYVGMMYFVQYGELDVPDQGTIMGLLGRQGALDYTTLILIIDFYKSTGVGDTFLNTVAIDLDNSESHYWHHTRDILGYPSTIGSDWKDIYGFNFARFQNYAVMTHSSGGFEPTVIYYNKPNDEMSYFLHSAGMYKTNPSYYPVEEVVRPMGLPFNQANLNPDIALKVENYTETDIPSGMWFKITSQYYDASTSAYEDWSNVVLSGKPNPFDKFSRYLRITIGTAQYVLRYVKDVSGPINTDLTFNDDHVFVLVLDSKSDPLVTVVAQAQTTTDFQVESFNMVDGFPDNSIFYEQRWVAHMNGRLFNSGVGNAFFMHQYRYTQATIVGKYYEPTGLPPFNPMYYVVSHDMLLGYSGQKVSSDAFDFIPLTETLQGAAWLNKGNSLELGGSTEVNSITGLEGGMYSFDSISSQLGTAQGSKSAISCKAGSDTIFVSGNNYHARSFYYDGRTRNYVSNNLNDINPEIFRHMAGDTVNDLDILIKEISYDTDDYHVYFVLSPQMSLIGLTYNRDTGISSWHRLSLGGPDGSPVEVFSSCFVRNDKSSNVRYVVTNRDGEFWLERFGYPYNKEEMNAFEVYGGGVSVDKLPYYLDFSTGFVGSFAANTPISIGLEYADTKVDVLANGYWISDVEVDSAGEITLDRAVRTLVVGYRYGTDIIPLEAEPSLGSSNGSFLHSIKNYNYVHLRLNRSYGGQITNTSVNQLERIPYDNDNMIVTSSLKLFSGAKSIHLRQNATSINKVRIYTDAPYPFEMLSILLKGEANER